MTTDWKPLESEILRRLDLRAEAVALGVEFTGNVTATGWCDCRAVDRDESRPSAGICISGNNGALGRYKDHGSGDDKSISFWDLAVKARRFSTWQEARDHYARKTGVDLPGTKDIVQRDGAGRTAADYDAAGLSWIADRIFKRNGYHRPVEPAEKKQRGKGFETWQAAVQWYSRKNNLGEPTGSWVYHDSSNTEVFVVVRFDLATVDKKTGKPEKEFRPFRVFDGKWNAGDPKGKLPLYHLPQLATVARVYVTEGEKAADAIISIGLAATTSAHGSKSPGKTDWSSLGGKDAVLLPDNDPAGSGYAGKVAELLGKLEPAPAVKVVELPGLPLNGDAVEFVATRRQAGKSDAEIAAEIESLANAAEKADLQAGEAAIVNYQCVGFDEHGHPIFAALNIEAVLNGIRDKTEDWPRRVGSSLFVHDQNHGIGFLDTPAALFGFLHRRAGCVKWRMPEGAVGKQEIFSELKRTATNYLAVEQLPHEPPIVGHYYACEAIEPGDGTTLRALIDRFCPETDIDRDLILSAFLTPCWGGPAGCRPCFVITSDSGRGAGKSSLAEMVGRVYGGVLQFTHNEEISKIKTRLLSPDSLARRVALLDNVKSLKFSWAELEGLLTATTIGGHRMYAGEAVRPNTLVWFITLNGASLSTDMAQRSVIIKINKPNRSAKWIEETQAFIDEKRIEIVGDIIGILREEPATLDRFTRWASWEREILARLPEPAEAQAVILDRQASVDVEVDEVEIIEDYFFGQLEILRYVKESDRIFIPSEIAAKWFNEATNERKGSAAVGRILNQFCTEKKCKQLTRNTNHEIGRGFVWCPKSSAVTFTCTDLRRRIAEKLAGTLNQYLTKPANPNQT